MVFSYLLPGRIPFPLRLHRIGKTGRSRYGGTCTDVHQRGSYFPAKHAEDAGPGELTWDFFVGFRVEEVNYGDLGEVTEVDTATINTLFVVDHQGEELLIPAQEEFILNIDQKHKVITMDLPKGLLALDETEEV